jgi:Flp pilus assembly protein CpaB
MSFAYIVAIIVLLHFLVGIGYLVYKITTAKPADETIATKEDEQPKHS